MAQDNATINLYINNEQAKGAIAELDKAYEDLKDARKAADAAGDNQLSLELQAQELNALQKLRLARKGILDIEKSMENLTKVNVRQLHLIRKTLNAQMREMNQDSEDFLETQKKLLRVEEQIANARGRNVNAKGLGGAIKNAWSNVMPSVGLLGVFTGAVALFKSGVSEIWNLTKTIQGDSKRAMTVFGDQLGYVEMQADKLSKKMGVTNREFVSMTTGVADLLIPLDFTRREAAKMAVDVQKLAGALNEWTAGKIGVQGVSDILTKAMLGETEGLKQLGIAIRMDSEEYKTLVKQKEREGAASTAQAQSLAILDLLYKKSADAQTAYNSSGNELLRFQNSAARGWRAMTESIAEWFAYSADERLDIQTRKFSAYNAEVERNEQVFRRLIPRYDELSSKTSLNSDEQSELRTIIDSIVTIVPQAASGFDEYGKALSVNTTAVADFREASRLLKIEMQKEITDDLAEGVRNNFVQMNRTKVEIRQLEAQWNSTDPKHVESRNDLRLQINELQNELIDLEKQAGKSVTTMRGIGLTTDEIAGLVNTAWTFKSLGLTAKVTGDDVDQFAKKYSNSINLLNVGGSSTVISNSLIDQKKKEIEEAKKMAETTEAEIVAKNKRLAQLNKELKRLEGLGVSSEKPKSYSLDADENYSAEKYAIKERYLKGEYTIESDYSRDLLALEIRTLEARIASNKEKGEDMAKLKEQLLDKQIAQAKDAKKREEALLRVTHGGDDELAKAKRDYENRRKELGLFNKQESEMTASEKAALIQIEKEYRKKLSSLTLDSLSKGIAKQREGIDRKSSALRIAQNDELAKADTFEKKKDLVQKLYAGQKLGVVTSEEEAVKLIRAKYAQNSEAELKKHLEELLKTYQATAEAISASGGLLDDVQLSEEDQQKLFDTITKLKDELGKLTDADPKDKKNKETQTDVLGMTADDWSTLFENTENGLTSLEKMEIAAKSIGDAFSEVSNLISAIEQREFKQYEKNQNEKKKILDRQLKSGQISQEHYNDKIQQLDEETDAKRQEMERKQAERQKMLAIFQAVVNTAVAVSGALGAPPAGPWNIALAAIIGALGAVQIATIAATPLPGAEDGGMLVERTQDGKRYNALYEPNRRGVVDRPTVLVGENGTEYVVPADGYRNPTIAPVLDIIESARRSGALKSLNLTAAMQRVMVPGRADGGNFSTTPVGPMSKSVDLTPTDNNDRGLSQDEQRELLLVLKRISEQMDNPVPAKVAMTGSEGLARQYDKYKSLRDRSTIGRRKQQ